MSRYRANVVERVQAAQHIQAKTTGVNQIQPAREKAETVEEFLARGGVIERLPNNFDGFVSDYITVSNYGT